MLAAYNLEDEPVCCLLRDPSWQATFNRALRLRDTACSRGLFLLLPHSGLAGIEQAQVVHSDKVQESLRYFWFLDDTDAHRHLTGSTLPLKSDNKLLYGLAPPDDDSHVCSEKNPANMDS